MHYRAALINEKCWNLVWRASLIWKRDGGLAIDYREYLGVIKAYELWWLAYEGEGLWSEPGVSVCPTLIILTYINAIACVAHAHHHGRHAALLYRQPSTPAMRLGHTNLQRMLRTRASRLVQVSQWHVIRSVHATSLRAQAEPQLQEEQAFEDGAAPVDGALAQQQQRREQRRQQLSAPLQRERIAADGSLRVARDAYQQQHRQQQETVQQQQQQQHPRPPGLAAAAPVAPPLPAERLEELVDLITASKRVLVITGAGVSTESNIPDYRGPTGAYTTGEWVAFW